MMPLYPFHLPPDTNARSCQVKVISIATNSVTQFIKTKETLSILSDRPLHFKTLWINQF